MRQKISAETPPEFPRICLLAPFPPRWRSLRQGLRAPQKLRIPSAPGGEDVNEVPALEFDLESLGFLGTHIETEPIPEISFMHTMRSPTARIEQQSRGVVHVWFTSRDLWLPSKYTYKYVYRGVSTFVLFSEPVYKPTDVEIARVMQQLRVRPRSSPSRRNSRLLSNKA